MQPRNVGVAVVVGQPHKFPLRTPPADLTFQISAGFAEIGESDGGRVDGVQVCQHPDQCVDTAFDDVLVAQGLEFSAAADHLSGNVFDHLERRTEHRHRRCTARPRGPPEPRYSASAATTLYSRAMSCADGVSPCSGGRRSTHFDESSATRKVRLERPPEISCARSSPVTADAGRT